MSIVGYDKGGPDGDWTVKVKGHHIRMAIS